MSIRESIDTVLEKKKLQKQQLANILMITPQYLSEIYKGKKNPSKSLLRRLNRYAMDNKIALSQNDKPHNRELWINEMPVDFREWLRNKESTPYIIFAKMLSDNRFSDDEKSALIKLVCPKTEEVKVSEGTSEVQRNRANQVDLISDFKRLLDNRYESFKSTLLDNNFTPDTTEVWKMYTNSFYENTGIYIHLADVLKLELYDANGKLNECHIYSDNINKKLNDLCTDYVREALP